MNVIWIFGDQHPAHALSCNGDPNLNTPNLDRLAAEGQLGKSRLWLPAVLSLPRLVTHQPLSTRMRARSRTSTAAGDADHRQRLQ